MERHKPIIIDQLPEAFNVCGQELREVLKTDVLSIAHVRMQPGAVSLEHLHQTFTEIYDIRYGEGVMKLGDDEFVVTDNTVVVIPPGTPHMLANTGEMVLEHTVICHPPFNPEDIQFPDSEVNIDT